MDTATTTTATTNKQQQTKGILLQQQQQEQQQQNSDNNNNSSSSSNTADKCAAAVINNEDDGGSNADDIDRDDGGRKAAAAPKKKPRRRVVWDEENLEECERNKDSTMKIDEPNTPYNFSFVHSDEEDELAAEDVLQSLQVVTQALEQLQQQQQQKQMNSSEWDTTSGDEASAISRSDENHAKKFEARRKAHYDEFRAASLLKSKGVDLADEQDEDADVAIQNVRSICSRGASQHCADDLSESYAADDECEIHLVQPHGVKRKTSEV